MPPTYADRVEGIAGGVPIPVTPGPTTTLADNLPNPTIPGVGAYLLIWDGTQFRRLRGDSLGDVNGNPQAPINAGAYGMVYNSATGVWARQTGDITGSAIRAATLNFSLAGAVNAITTATLPAAGAGLFHYITHLHIRRVATAALAGGALLSVTTTNLNGRAWRTGNQASITVGTFDGATLIDQEYVHPLRSSVANVATTIVCPAAGAAVSWQIIVDYYVAA